jgi:hypothetical protein
MHETRSIIYIQYYKKDFHPQLFSDYKKNVPGKMQEASMKLTFMELVAVTII